MGVGAIGQPVHLQTGTFKVDKTSKKNIFGTTSVKFDIKTGNNMTRRTGFKAGAFRKLKAIAHCNSSTRSAQRVIRHGELKLSQGVNKMVSEMANKSANNQTQLSPPEIAQHLKDIADGAERFMRAGGNNNLNAVQTRVQANLEQSLEALRGADRATFDQVLSDLRTQMAQVDALIIFAAAGNQTQLGAISRAMHAAVTAMDRKYNVDVFVNNPAHNNTYNDFTGPVGLVQLNAVFEAHLVRLPSNDLKADIRAHYQAMGTPNTAQDVQNMVTAFKSDIDYAETTGYTPWQNVDYLYTDPTSNFSTQAMASDLLTEGMENFDWLEKFKNIEANQDTMAVTQMRDEIGELLELCKEEDWLAAWQNPDEASNDDQHVNIGQDARVNFLKGIADITGTNYDESYDLDSAIAALSNMPRNDLKEVLSALKTPRAGLDLSDYSPYKDLHANATQILGLFKSTLR